MTTMAERRQLLIEIDRTFKLIAEGLDSFDEKLEAMKAAPNKQQKEKHMAELKEELKKLQRYRAKVMTWTTCKEVKDKRAVFEDQRLIIETRMETYREMERADKTKPFSEKALEAEPKIDPIQKDRDDVFQWLRHTISELESQTEPWDAELERMTGESTGGRSIAAKIDDLRLRISQNQQHVSKLELIMRYLHNDSIGMQDVKDLRDTVEAYVESQRESHGAVDIDYLDIYDDILESVRENDQYLLVPLAQNQPGALNTAASIDDILDGEDGGHEGASITTTATATAAASISSSQHHHNQNLQRPLSAEPPSTTVQHHQQQTQRKSSIPMSNAIVDEHHGSVITSGGGGNVGSGSHSKYSTNKSSISSSLSQLHVVIPAPAPPPLSVPYSQAAAPKLQNQVEMESLLDAVNDLPPGGVRNEAKSPPAVDRSKAAITSSNSSTESSEIEDDDDDEDEDDEDDEDEDEENDEDEPSSDTSSSSREDEDSPVTKRRPAAIAVTSPPKRRAGASPRADDDDIVEKADGQRRLIVGYASNKTPVAVECKQPRPISADGNYSSTDDMLALICDQDQLNLISQRTDLLEPKDVPRRKKSSTARVLPLSVPPSGGPIPFASPFVPSGDSIQKRINDSKTTMTPANESNRDVFKSCGPKLSFPVPSTMNPFESVFSNSSSAIPPPPASSTPLLRASSSSSIYKLPYAGYRFSTTSSTANLANYGGYFGGSDADEAAASRRETLKLLEAAYKHLPHPDTSVRSGHRRLWREQNFYYQNNPNGCSSSSTSTTPLNPNYPLQQNSNFCGVDFGSRPYYTMLADETLLFVFYHLQGTLAHRYATESLEERGWMWHTQRAQWFKHETADLIALRHQMEGLDKKNGFVAGSFKYFDYEKWEERLAPPDFVFRLDNWKTLLPASAMMIPTSMSNNNNSNWPDDLNQRRPITMGSNTIWKNDQKTTSSNKDHSI